MHNEDHDDQSASFHADMVSVSEEDGVLMVAFGAPGGGPYLLLQRTLAPTAQDRLHEMHLPYVEWSSQARSTYGHIVAASVGDGNFLLAMDAEGAEEIGARRIRATFAASTAKEKELRDAVARLLQPDPWPDST